MNIARSTDFRFSVGDLSLRGGSVAIKDINAKDVAPVTGLGTRGYI